MGLLSSSSVCFFCLLAYPTVCFQKPLFCYEVLNMICKPHLFWPLVTDSLAREGSAEVQDDGQRWAEEAADEGERVVFFVLPPPPLPSLACCHQCQQAPPSQEAWRVVLRRDAPLQHGRRSSPMSMSMSMLRSTATVANDVQQCLPAVCPGMHRRILRFCI